MLPERAPLLTIAVPTFNRAEQLRTLLQTLLPQLAAFPQVEVLVSDNASGDTTQQVLAQAAHSFPSHLRTHRQSANIGPDRNFAFCFEHARGRFFWLCGDDDIITPGALAQIVPLLENTADLDLVYATSYGFRQDFAAERRSDPLGRTVQTFTSARSFARVANIMLTFISGIIVNRQRLLELGLLAEPQRYVGTNLVQLSWSLPLLLEHRRSLIVWARPVAARQGDAHGYALGEVFGAQLLSNLTRLLPNRPDLQRAILHPTLRRWLPSVIVAARRAGEGSLAVGEASTALAKTYGGSLRFWIFTWPALRLPLPLAIAYERCTSTLSKVLSVVRQPGLLRRKS